EDSCAWSAVNSGCLARRSPENPSCSSGKRPLESMPDSRVFSAPPCVLPRVAFRAQCCPRFPRPGRTEALPRFPRPGQPGETNDASPWNPLLRGWPHDAANATDKPLPSGSLCRQLLPARMREPGILCLPIVCRRAPKCRDPAAIFEAVQRRIQRAMLHLQDVFGPLLDRVSDGMSMCRSQHERLEYQHVERALQHVAFRSLPFRHGFLNSTLYELLVEYKHL